MGGMKRKIAMEKIEKQDSRTVAFSKRRLGLYNKATELCLLSGAQIAILATPVSSKSNVSFYSFGHSSVDSVVSSFLANQRPRDDNIAVQKGLRFWWEDERLAKSENSKELSDAIDSISSMLQNLKGLQSEAVENRREAEDLKKKKKKKKKDVVSHGTHQELDQNQTLKFQSCSASICIQDDSPASLEGFIKNREVEDQIVAISDNVDMKKDVNLHEIHQALNLQSCSPSNCIQDDSPANLEEFIKNSEEDNPIVAISDKNSNNNNNGLLGNLDGCNEELDLDEIFDFETKSYEGISKNLEMDDVSANLNPFSDSDAVEDGGLVIHLSDLDENHIIASSDNNNSCNNNDIPGNLGGYNQEFEFFDFVMNCEDLSMNLEDLLD